MRLESDSAVARPPEPLDESEPHEAARLRYCLLQMRHAGVGWDQAEYGFPLTMTFSSLRSVTPEVLSLSFLMVTSKSLKRTLLMSVWPALGLMVPKEVYVPLMPTKFRFLTMDLGGSMPWRSKYCVHGAMLMMPLDGPSEVMLRKVMSS